jgi:hypothetical protein
MRAFKNELLEYLLENSGQSVDIKHIVDKYCGEDATFDPNDQTLVSCRLNINLVLRELVEMKWINMYPTNGLSTGHHLNHETNRREFINDIPVKARMTTIGEMGYNQSIRTIPPPGHTVIIGGNSSGDVLVNSQKSTESFDFAQRPAEIPHAKANNSKSIWSTIFKWIFDKIWIIISGLLIAYLAYKLGFKK